MTCDCEKRKETDDAECPPGMTKGPDGKCVKNEKKTEQIGDPKTQSTQGTLPSGDSGEVQTADQHPCDEGHVWDETQQMCVPIDKKDPGDGQTQGTDKTASIEKNLNTLTSVVTKMAEQQASLNPSKRPTAHTSTEFADETLSIEEIGQRIGPALQKYGKFEFNMPLEYFRSINVGPANPSTGVTETYRPRSAWLKVQEAYKKPNKTIHEAVAITNTHATQDLDLDVAIVPGGVTFVPVFQFAKVQRTDQGSDRARFFKTTLPTPATQTVGTTATESTQTITAIEVTPSTITGNYLIGDFDEIENSPFDLIQTIVEGAAATYDDFVATDMLTTVSAEGTLTPGLWINAEDGTTITTSDTASITFDETGVAFGREYLEDQGYLRGGVKPVLALHPKQWRQLITSTNVTSLAAHSTPDIWLKAQLEEFMGVQLVVTNAVEIKTDQTTTAYNALMFIPKHSYGIAVKRDVTVKFHDIPEDNQVRTNTTWRTKSGVIDASSIVRITSTVA